MPWQLLMLVLIVGVRSEELTECYPGTDDTFCGNVPSTCEDTKYRSSDGSCNNLEHSWWGTPRTPYRRLLGICKSDVEPIYDKNLPYPRALSRALFVDLDVKDTILSLLFMQYGQIIAHDMSLTSGVAQTRKDAIICCSDEGKPTSETNPRCAPIKVPEDDPYHALEGKTCINFIRLETTKHADNCTNATEIPEPLTAVNCYLDVSYLYGNDPATAKRVREGRGGRLASVHRNGREFLPQNPDPKTACNVDSPTEACYYTGDVRVNQNPQLALLHIIYMQHHNYIAARLRSVNPQWDDETLFQETRRIIIAMHQWIIYNEFLPGLIAQSETGKWVKFYFQDLMTNIGTGKEFMIENNLFYPNATGYIDDYNPTVNPAVSNEFATSAYRIFHSGIVGMLRSTQECRNTSVEVSLSDWFVKPSICEHAGFFDGLTRGLTTQPQSAMDRFHTNDVLNLMFKTGLLGHDLKAIDIQRSRDQGVCSYSKALRAFNIANPQCFDDFKKFIKPEIVSVLKKLYKSFEDVELSVAMFVEKRLPGSLVSALAQRILGEQFYRARVGDRYFFENGYGKGAFTIDQVNEIRKSTIAQILCINGNIRNMQAEAFKLISKKNPLMSCMDIHKFNPLPWKEPFEKKNCKYND